MPEKARTKVSVVLSVGKVCKPSVRYQTIESGAPISNIYVMKTFANPMPDKIKVTIEPAD